MRGKGSQRGELASIGGITPAYAGKSVTEGLCTLCGRDHPRVCGEKYIYIELDGSPKGSPPRMRGKD